MNNTEPVKERRMVWVEGLVVLGFLTIFPFISQREGLFAVFSRGDFSHTIWSLLGDMPILSVFPIIASMNLVLNIIRFTDRSIHYLVLSLNLAGIVLFVIQFVILQPEMPLGIGAFLLFFTFLRYLSKTVSHLGFIRGDTFISGSILSIEVLLVIFILLPLCVILGRSVIRGLTIS